jgi:hypothetical protein
MAETERRIETGGNSLVGFGHSCHGGGYNMESWLRIGTGISTRIVGQVYQMNPSCLSEVVIRTRSSPLPLP